MARPSKYESQIKPHLKEIRKAVQCGATVKEIASAFNIATITLHKYKKEIKEFSDTFTCGRAKVVIDIKAALLKKAKGYEYREKREYVKEGTDGEKITYKEETTRHQPPSETAAAMLLRNYDKKWIDRDNVSTELKLQEMELKKAIAESNNFDLELKGETENGLTTLLGVKQ